MNREIVQFLEALRASVSEAPQVHSNGSQLIGPQPCRGDIAYLHVIHPALDAAGIDELQNIYGRTFSDALRSTYATMNGAELFETSLSLFGLVRHFTRDPSARNPFSPELPSQSFAGRHPGWNRLNFFPVGALTLYSLSFVIACNDAGEVVVLSDAGDAIRKYSNLAAALTMLSAELAPFWSEDRKRVTPKKLLDQIASPSGTA